VLKLASLRRVDLLLNFSIGGLRRTAGEALSSPDSGIGEKVNKFFGTTDWRKIPIRADGSMPAHEWIDFYKERLSKATNPSYLWGTDISVKNSRRVELYRLLFASKDKLGIKLWEDARQNAPIQRSLF
jgi:three-Cys-motif partner protein